MRRQTPFPFDLFGHDAMPGPTGEIIRATRHLSTFPPYPWGQWLYGRVMASRWAALEGDVIELGVAYGGMSIFLAGLACPHGKKVWSYDSFGGLPEPDPRRDNPFFKAGDFGPGPDGPDLLSRFEREISDFGLNGLVVPVKGFFDETLRLLRPGQRFCFAHLDSDLYSSVLTSLEAVYDRVVEGGVVVIDDFFHHGQGPLRAAADFFNARRERPVYHVSFPYSVFVFKGKAFNRPPGKRSLDGNVYSFERLRRDGYFMEVLRESVATAAALGEAGESFRSRKELLRLLETGGHRSSDVYVYLKALGAFWDSFADYAPDARPALLL